MSGGKHTPGPWRVEGHYKHGQAVVADESLEVALCWSHNARLPSEQMDANAHLIAAAPDLLEAAELLARAGAVTYEGATCPLCSYPTNEHSMGCPVSYATRAIAKAKGDRS